MSEADPDLVPEARISWKFRLGLMLAATLGMLFVLACGGIALLMGTIETPTSPAAVNDLKQEITAIDLPEGYQPSGGVRSHWLDFRLVSYTQAKPPGYIILLGSPYQRVRMQQFLQDEKQRLEIEPLSIQSTDTQSLPVSGQEVEVQISIAQGQETETLYKQIRCAFTQGEQNLLLEWILPASEYQEQELREMLDSIP